MTGELKAKCIEELQVYTKGFQERRAAVTDELVADFMSLKKLEWKGNPNPSVIVQKENEAPTTGESADGSTALTQNQLKKIAKQKLIDEKKAAKAAEKAAKAAGGS